MKKIRWGVLSTANIAQTQVIPAIVRAENAELIAMASRGSKVHAVASKLKVPKAYESYEELLHDPTIDAIYIPLPNHLHKEWVVKAAEQGKHILCEKPAALSASEAAEMVELCHDHNVKFMEGFMYQLHPQHARVKEVIASGEIGEVKLIKSSHSFYLENRAKDIRMDKAMGGGSLYDLGCYTIHVTRYLTDAEPIEVQALASFDAEAGVDISTYGYMKMANGVTAIFDCSFDMAARNEYEVVGTKGTIKVSLAFRPDVNGGNGSLLIQSDGVTREENIEGDIYRLEIEHFSEAILNDSSPAITGQSTIRNMQVIEACYQSIQTGQPVEINQS
ncbi:Gfo/Idh/MocA family oxidoreductase [Sporosarcina sp. ACRSM]|uniref:Gfo/Idh/MocA family protein n=1 Tax=Sporosarcina sp. ACRSM TaxID=2918216 RepID=UPI001EF704CC|nr:Gfo/Idh/MocA family oxidoreductase [Sporosarcina sp. ACRSM]MCG7336543.1 Gfo/Idh/MocA family oxidoreductase [Sporosarcina sp. ACRSM]